MPPAGPKKALYISSPIGLGHALRDVAIAAELRQLHPDLQIDWLAQHPVTKVLEDRGERVHPASEWLANESAHVEDESAEHDLHAFQAIRRMDEILVNNFMVFNDVVTDEHYDLVIGDEAWDVDYFLHENPELKHFEFAWMTDFVGWLPMPDGGDHEAALTADYNAEMIEQRARYRAAARPLDLRRRSRRRRARLVRARTCRRSASGRRRTSSSPATSPASIPPSSPTARRCAPSSGIAPTSACASSPSAGPGVGGDLLRRVIDAIPATRRLVDDVKFVVVCGPRIDPRRCPGARVCPTAVTSRSSIATSPLATSPSCRAG